MLKIGVTGGIGSGKTAVCSIFARSGVPVLFADDIAKDLSNSNLEIHKQLNAILGSSTYLSDGTLNRQFIASQIFSNKKLKSQVEAIIHPRVEEEIERRAKDLQRNGHKFIIIEAALIYEVGLHKKLDAVVVVDTDEEVRLQRVKHRDGFSGEAVRQRIKAQLDTKKKVAKADYVIMNNNSLEALERKVHFLYSIFIRLANGV